MPGFQDLVAGYRRFRSQTWRAQRERWAQLTEGQSPKVMVIACSDSRVDPAQIFDTRPGEIFVVRNVANLVPPFERGGGRHGVSAALEFAVTQLEVEEILVFGHGQCGGCAAALSGQFRRADEGEGGFIGSWLELLDDARVKVRVRHGGRVDGAACRAMEHAAVKVSLDNLRSFPWIRDREGRGRVTLRGAWFSIAEGVLYLLSPETGEFNPVS